MDNEERIRNWLKSRPAHTSADAVHARSEASGDPLAALHKDESGNDSPQNGDDDQDTEKSFPSAALDRIKTEIDRRRTENRADLIRKVVIFVGIPLALIFGYTALFATPLYTGEAAFTVQTDDASGGPPPTAGLVALPGNSTMITDAFKARTFILSRPMMRYMEKKHGFMSHFNEMDFLSRPGGISGETRDALAYYRQRVRVIIDIQDGIVKLEVDARTPEDAVRFGNAILSATERHVNAISDRIAADQIAGLTQRTNEAERALTDARLQLARVRSRKGEISPEQSASVIYGLISNLELQLAEAKGQQKALLDDGLINSPLLPPLNAKIEELAHQIREHRERLSSHAGGGSLAQTASAFEGATIAQDIALSRWQSMLEALQQAYLQTLSDRRYVVTLVETTANSDPKVQDWWSIAKPILIVLLILCGVLFALRKSASLPDDFGLPKLRELANRWK